MSDNVIICDGKLFRVLDQMAGDWLSVEPMSGDGHRMIHLSEDSLILDPTDEQIEDYCPSCGSPVEDCGGCLCRACGKPTHLQAPRSCTDQTAHDDEGGR